MPQPCEQFVRQWGFQPRRGLPFAVLRTTRAGPDPPHVPASSSTHTRVARDGQVDIGASGAHGAMWSAQPCRTSTLHC